PARPSSSARLTATWPSPPSAVRAAPLPDASPSGAATTTSRPASRAARASARSPSLAMPSSLVITARGRSVAPTWLPCPVLSRFAAWWPPPIMVAGPAVRPAHRVRSAAVQQLGERGGHRRLVQIIFFLYE